MLKSLSLVLLLLVAAPLFGRQAASEKITNDEYAIYSTLIDSRFLPRGTHLAVIDSTVEFDINEVPIPKEFDDDLLPKIGKTYRLDRRLHIRVKYLLLTPIQLDRLFKRGVSIGWNSYWKTYHHATGLLSLSRVGYNSTRTRAFVYVAEACGPRCGNGYTYVLEKQNGAWKIRDEKQLWIA